MIAAIAGLEFRHGRWEDVLADVECDLWAPDPPYGERTHRGHDAGSKQRDKLLCTNSRELGYEFLRPEDVHALVEHWSPRTRGWMCPMTSHDLIPHWEEAFRAAGRYWFAPIPVLEFYRPRLLGDGPGSRAVYLIPARPRSAKFLAKKWGSLPGDYRGPIGPLPTDLLAAGHYERSEGEARPSRMGGKSLSVCRAIVRDYSRPGDVVCDTHAGHGTMLLAALIEGRRAIGAEMKSDAYQAALGNLQRAGQGPLFEQLQLAGGEA